MTSITHEAPALGLGGDQPASVTDALAYAADYQAMAAFLAEHPEIAANIGMSPAPPAPFTGRIGAIWSAGFATTVCTLTT